MNLNFKMIQRVSKAREEYKILYTIQLSSSQFQAYELYEEKTALKHNFKVNNK